MAEQFDFEGWATRANIKCGDGRTIMPNAFKDDDGRKVPLVWMHLHDDPSNVLGHALLENRDSGVYAYCSFNNSDKAQQVKDIVQHGDVTALSIYANKLQQRNGDVLHGKIREVSVVLAGANPGACIEYPILEHDDDEPDQAIIHNDDGTVFLAATDDDAEIVEHADDKKEDDVVADNNEKTLQDVFDTLNDEQKTLVWAMIAQAVADKENEAKHSDLEEGEDIMTHNVFENEATQTEDGALTHSEMQTIIDDVFKTKRYNSLRDSVLSHSAEYGIEDIDWLFPKHKLTDTTPQFIKRDTDWVSGVMNGVKKTPFSRIRSIFADITADAARAKGYVKGTQKVSEVITLLRRRTDPTTIYKMQKFDRDDVIDITDFDVIAWIKMEMRLMLDEEIARAILVGDGRVPEDPYKIDETKIRPVYTDADLYTIKKQVSVSANANEATIAKAAIKAAIKARKDYKGSGNPTFYTTEDVLTDMLLLEDGVGRPLYDSVEKLRTALRVSAIVTVPVMEGLSRTVTVESVEKTYPLLGIIVNLSDYNVGADKGGSVSMFEDFDIDFNQQKYLIETRCSGALVVPKSAIVLELDKAAA